MHLKNVCEVSVHGHDSYEAFIDMGCVSAFAAERAIWRLVLEECCVIVQVSCACFYQL